MCGGTPRAGRDDKAESSKQMRTPHRPVRTAAHALPHQAEQQSAAVAEFEVRTTKRIINNIVQQRFEALKARQEADLNVRRQKLADKLEADDAALKAELLASRKTPEQRRAELAARARELAARREAERQSLAATLYEKAFIENCDVLRDANSKRVLYRTVDERNAQVRCVAGLEAGHALFEPTACSDSMDLDNALNGPARERAWRLQIEQKMAQKILEQEEKRMWHEMNESERARAEQRYVATGAQGARMFRGTGLMVAQRTTPWTV